MEKELSLESNVEENDRESSTDQLVLVKENIYSLVAHAPGNLEAFKRDVNVLLIPHGFRIVDDLPISQSIRKDIAANDLRRQKSKIRRIADVISNRDIPTKTEIILYNEQLAAEATVAISVLEAKKESLRIEAEKLTARVAQLEKIEFRLLNHPDIKGIIDEQDYSRRKTEALIKINGMFSNIERLFKDNTRGTGEKIRAIAEYFLGEYLNALIEFEGSFTKQDYGKLLGDHYRRSLSITSKEFDFNDEIIQTSLRYFDLGGSFLKVQELSAQYLAALRKDSASLRRITLEFMNLKIWIERQGSSQGQ